MSVGRVIGEGGFQRLTEAQPHDSTVWGTRMTSAPFGWGSTPARSPGHPILGKMRIWVGQHMTPSILDGIVRNFGDSHFTWFRIYVRIFA